MTLTRRFSVHLTAAAIMFAAFSAIAQKRPNFNRPSTYDVQHYIIRASFDRVNKRVIGDTTVSLKPLNDGLRSVDLDAVDLSFESVTLDPAGAKLVHKVSPGKVSIT